MCIVCSIRTPSDEVTMIPVAADRAAGASRAQRGIPNVPGGGAAGGASAAAGAARNARGAAEVRREDGSVQCTFSGNGDDFIDQHW